MLISAPSLPLLVEHLQLLDPTMEQSSFASERDGLIIQ